MGNLIALGFDRSWAAREVLNGFRTEPADHAFVVERSASGRCVMRRADGRITLEAADPLERWLWGQMVGVLFLNASLDLAIPRGSSALFMRLNVPVEKRILQAAKPYRGCILKTSLSREAEQRLNAGYIKAA